MFRIRPRWLKTRAYFNDSPPPPPPPAVPPVPPPPPAPRTFTQDEVNAMIAADKRKVKAENDALVAQLEELRKASGLTQQQKDELDARITTLSQQHLTDQQRLQAQLDAANKKAKEQAEALEGESRKWKGEYEKLLVTNEIILGATEAKAARNEQMLDLLLPKAKVVPEMGEDGQPTGRYVAKLPMTVIDSKTKKPVVVELPVREAIAEMRKQPGNENLFLTDGKPGIGGINHGGGGGGGPVDVTKMSPADFRKMRDASYAAKPKQ